MKLIVDNLAGFCMGVRNAVEKVTTELEKQPLIYIHGDIIHNPQTISILKKKGLISYKDFNEVPAKSCVAIRTHGIPYNEYVSIKNHASSIVNLCCSRVTKIQSIIKKAGLTNSHVIICGYHDHPEVKSLQSYASNGVTVIKHPDEIDLVPLTDKLLLISQTTFDEELFYKISDAAKIKFGNRIDIINTICRATHDRQKNLISLLTKNQVTKLIVIGGRQSSNTKRLADIGKSRKIATYHIEELAEFDLNTVVTDDTIVVTAGASTPDYIINEVINALNELQK
ncbi:MAG TPA: 4-hydroxy-3-methylbut-2-enyl diphosphate reductase [Spirochaetota bacterium]|nr:4-hydroxy-3-methylbut-2-enyl diphosphate reductase [Spirochaetota bacterium]